MCFAGGVTLKKYSNIVLTYTSTFKAHNLETESSVVQLSECAWIETSDDYIEKPAGHLHSLLYFGFGQEDPQYGLSKFLQPLIDSPIRFRTVHTQKEANDNPFLLHDCTHIAIALSIVCDTWFVCGIESFGNSSNPNTPSIGSEFNFFSGKPDLSRLTKNDERPLLDAYKFVYRSLTNKSWESEENLLLFHYLKCVVRLPYQRFTVLKIGLDHIFTEWHALILNAALFFERLLTEESSNRKLGVQQWNSVMGVDASLDEEFIEVLFNYRHTISHSNPTRAIGKIADWINHQQGDALSINREFRNKLYSAARSCFRAIVFEPENFIEFKCKRPK